MIVTTPFRVNIRAMPSVSGPVLDVMPVNAQAAAIGRNAGNNWLQVQYGETLGWVAKWVVVASSNTTGLPITSDIVEVQPLAPGATITGSSIYNIVIRSGPGTQFGDVGQIPAFTSVNLLARTADSAWVRVNYQGVEGWAAAWVMTASTDMNSLPPQQP